MSAIPFVRLRKKREKVWTHALPSLSLGLYRSGKRGGEGRGPGGERERKKRSTGDSTLAGRRVEIADRLEKSAARILGREGGEREEIAHALLAKDGASRRLASRKKGGRKACCVVPTGGGGKGKRADIDYTVTFTWSVCSLRRN